MTRVIPALYEGHAPIHLHQAFAEALDAYEGWGLEMDEPGVRLFDKEVPISSVFGRMRACFDILPERLRLTVVDMFGESALAHAGDHVTYADAAVLLRAMCVERLKAEAA